MGDELQAPVKDTLTEHYNNWKKLQHELFLMTTTDPSKLIGPSLEYVLDAYETAARESKFQEENEGQFSSTEDWKGKTKGKIESSIEAQMRHPPDRDINSSAIHKKATT